MKRMFFLFTFLALKANAQTLTEQSKDSLRIVICNMLAGDHNVRTEPVDVTLQKQTDSLRFYQLVEITKKFGFPSKERIGGTGCTINPFLVLLHNTDLLTDSTYFKLFVSECKKGNLDSWELGLALDRYYVHYFKKSMYGGYGKEKPCLEDMEIVNRNRRRIKLQELKKEQFKTCQ